MVIVVTVVAGLSLKSKNGYLANTRTAQRKDNKFPHHIDNCEVWCDSCNRSAKYKAFSF